MSGVDRSATRFSSTVAVAAALVAVVPCWLQFTATALAGTVGFLFLVAGVVTCRHVLVTAGAAGLFVGGIVAGGGGAPAPFVLVGAVATVVAWDAGRTGIDLGAQLGRSTPTRRLEVVHAAASTFVGCLTLGTAYVVYLLADGGRSVTLLALLVSAGVLVASALARQDRRP